MIQILYYLYFFGAGWALVDIIKDIRAVWTAEDLESEDKLVVIVLSMIYIIGGMTTSWLFVYAHYRINKD